MTLQEIAEKLIQEGSEYMIECEEEMTVGARPARFSKRKRIQKKLNKKYGLVPVVKKIKCQKLDVTVPMVLDFCQKHGYPIPEEIQGVNNQ